MSEKETDLLTNLESEWLTLEGKGMPIVCELCGKHVARVKENLTVVEIPRAWCKKHSPLQGAEASFVVMGGRFRRRG